MGTKPNLNPRPSSNFISNCLHCFHFFKFPAPYAHSLLQPRSQGSLPPFPTETRLPWLPVRHSSNILQEGIPSQCVFITVITWLISTGMFYRHFLLQSLGLKKERVNPTGFV